MQNVEAQFSVMPTVKQLREIEAEMYTADTIIFTSAKPFIDSHLQTCKSEYLPANAPLQSGKNWFYRKFLKEDFFIRQSEKYFLILNPIIDLSIGVESNKRILYNNTRGITASARLSKYFAFHSEVYENQFRLPLHVDAVMSQNYSMPSIGAARPYKTTDWDIFHGAAYFNCEINANHLISLAYGKQFIGDGYRSLLHSDVSPAYPYVRYIFHSARWQIERTTAVYLNALREKTYTFASPKKLSSMTLVSFSPNKNVSLSIFESTIWNSPDSVQRFKLFAGMLNVIPLINTLLSPNAERLNSIIGANIRCNFGTLAIYSQIACRNVVYERKRPAVQLGVKYFDAFRVKSLYFQAEINNLPANYATYERNRWINSTHISQSLTVPNENIGTEAIIIGAYSWRGLGVEYRGNFSLRKQMIQECEISYTINKRLNLEVYGSWNIYKMGKSNATQSVMLGMRTEIFNKYFDY